MIVEKSEALASVNAFIATATAAKAERKFTVVKQAAVPVLTQGKAPSQPVSVQVRKRPSKAGTTARRKRVMGTLPRMQSGSDGDSDFAEP